CRGRGRAVQRRSPRVRGAGLARDAPRSFEGVADRVGLTPFLAPPRDAGIARPPSRCRDPSLSLLGIQLGVPRADEFLPRLTRGSPCRLLSRTVDHDDQAPRGIDVRRLAADSAALERLIVAGPPLIAVTRARAGRDLGARCLSEPVPGDDRLA